MQKESIMRLVIGVMLLVIGDSLHAAELEIRLQSKTLSSTTLNAGDEIVTGQFTCRGKHHIWLNAEKASDVANSYIVRGKNNPNNILHVTLSGQGWGVDDSPESNGVTMVDVISDTRFIVAASINQTPAPDVYDINTAGRCLPVENHG